MGDVNYWNIFKALGGVKVGYCLLTFIVSIVLLSVGVLSEDGYIYMSTLALLSAVGGNLAGMGLHAFGKNKQGG
jgi:hypothetical protein